MKKPFDAKFWKNTLMAAIEFCGADYVIGPLYVEYYNTELLRVS